MRNIARIRRSKKSKHSPTIFLLTTTIERYPTIDHRISKLFLIDKILKLQLIALRKTFPSSEIFVVIGEGFYHLVHLQEQYNIKIIHNPQYNKFNEMYDISLGLAATMAKDAIIIVGNVIFNKAAIQTISQDVSKILIDSKGLCKESIGVVRQGHKLITLTYNTHPKWGNIVNLKGKELQNFTDFSFRSENKNLFLYEGINYLTSHDGVISIYDPRNPFLLKVFNYSHVQLGCKMIYT